MPAQTTNLFLLQDLEKSSRTSEFADADLNALQTIARWIDTFIAQPNEDLGRAGPICPFVPMGRERGTVWLAPAQIANQSVSDIVQLMNTYKQMLLRAQPTEGDDADYKAIVIVFTDLSADRAQDVMNDAQLQQFKRLSYAEDGVVIGDFHERNDGSAIYNSSFHPFRAPVPFLLMRRAVVSDWKFFLENEDWLHLWARRFGESAVQALAEQLRRTNWRRLERDAADETATNQSAAAV